jgi:site-specific DNA recombinase
VIEALHVRWMFARRLDGASVASIAHRRGGGWVLRTVAAILANPRCTGRQVDRQRAEQPGERASRRSRPTEWTISTTMAHPALISEAEFVASQQVKAVRVTKNGCSRRYLLSGILQCALCGPSVGLELGTRPRRVPLSAWLHQRPAATGG